MKLNDMNKLYEDFFDDNDIIVKNRILKQYLMKLNYEYETN